MGFSVSGATALLFVAFLIAFGVFYGATTGAVEQVQDAQIEKTDATIDTLNTEIRIDNATYNESDGNDLVVVANNTGATTLDINSTDLLVDGEYITDWQAAAEINGSSGSNLWLPQQGLVITVGLSEEPSRVKIVTEHSIAATATVEVVQ